MLEAQAPVTARALIKEIEMPVPLIDRARESYTACRGLERDIINELIFALTGADKEVARLRESHAELLVAAKEAFETLNRTQHNTEFAATNRLRAAIAKAEQS